MSRHFAGGAQQTVWITECVSVVFAYESVDLRARDNRVLLSATSAESEDDRKDDPET